MRQVHLPPTNYTKLVQLVGAGAACANQKAARKVNLVGLVGWGTSVPK